MKKNLLKLLGLLLVLGLSVAVFYSCNEDDDGNGNNGGSNAGNASRITATNVINGSAEIITVKAFAGWREDVIAVASYKNNGFTLELPTTLSAKYLEEIDEREEFFVSDKNVKTYHLRDIRGYDKFENEIGGFYLEEVDNDNWYDNSGHYNYAYTSWMYADRDVTINGEYKYIYDYEYDELTDRIDLILKKGWNVVYTSYTQRYKNGGYVRTFTRESQKPSGVNYSWIFEDDY